MMSVERVVVGRFEANCYVVSAGFDAVVIDPGGDPESILHELQEADSTARAVLGTHAHYDHVAAALPLVERLDAPFHLHPGDRHLLERVNLYGALFLGEPPIAVPPVAVELTDGMLLRFGGLDCRVVHVPGHTPGSVCFEIGGTLFTGDTLTAVDTGRTDLPGGDADALRRSLSDLSFRYPPSTAIHPGHGPSTTLGRALATAQATDANRAACS